MNISAWRYYAELYRGSYRAVWLSIAGSILMSAFVLPVAYFVRLAVDKAIPEGDLRLLVLAGISLFLLNLGNSCVTLWTRHATLKLTKTATRRLRENLLQKVYSFSRGYYSRADRKKLHANIVQDTERLDNLSQNLIMILLPSVLIGIVLGCVLIVLNWYLSLIAASIVPFFVIANRFMAKKVRQRAHEYQRIFVVFSKGVQFVLQVLELTWILSAETFEMGRQRKTLENVQTVGRSMNWLTTAYYEVNSMMIASMMVVIMIVGGMAIIAGSMTLGDLLSFYVILSILRTHASSVSSSMPLVITVNESLVALHGILSVEDKKPYDGSIGIEFRGGITLRDVSFQYNDRPLLRNVNLEIQPHDTVAIVGPNGVGKSTIINLILGFYRPQQGRIYADDHPYDEIDLAGLRQGIGVVPQDPILFPGTILENITYGHPEASRAEVNAAAVTATAHEFIAEFPQGYETPIGEHGILLSGGQRQRIAVARALLRHPKLLVLDEPTNHLDTTSVRKLMVNLHREGHGPSILLISHDKGVVQNADHIFHLHRGGTVEKGFADLS